MDWGLESAEDLNATGHRMRTPTVRECGMDPRNASTDETDDQNVERRVETASAPGVPIPVIGFHRRAHRPRHPRDSKPRPDVVGLQGRGLDADTLLPGCPEPGRRRGCRVEIRHSLITKTPNRTPRFSRWRTASELFWSLDDRRGGRGIDAGVFPPCPALGSAARNLRILVSVSVEID